MPSFPHPHQNSGLCLSVNSICRCSPSQKQQPTRMQTVSTVTAAQTARRWPQLRCRRPSMSRTPPPCTSSRAYRWSASAGRPSTRRTHTTITCSTTPAAGSPTAGSSQCAHTSSRPVHRTPSCFACDRKVCFLPLSCYLFIQSDSSDRITIITLAAGIGVRDLSSHSYSHLTDHALHHRYRICDI